MDPNNNPQLTDYRDPNVKTSSKPAKESSSSKSNRHNRDQLTSKNTNNSKRVDLKNYPINTLTIENQFFSDECDLKLLVSLPEGESSDEWIACHTPDFLQQLQWLYGTIKDECTPTCCPIMDAGPRTEYNWADGKTGGRIRTPVKLPAIQYCANLFQWVRDQLDDEMKFPSKIGDPFPVDFKNTCSNIYRRLFRVYAHVYHKHFDVIVRQKMEAHLNTSFKHFILFVRAHNLIPSDKDTAPLHCLIAKIVS